MNMMRFYNSPIICPPIEPDNPLCGNPSDHWVPVCTPHTDRFKPPSRNYKIIKCRPLPQSGVRRFGEWIVQESWASVDDKLSPSEQVTAFEKLCQDKLNEFCPVKQVRLSTHDKPFMTADLKSLHRRKCREYEKRGKTTKYYSLKDEFHKKYKIGAQNYLDKNVHELKESNPGQAYATLKKLGAQPGDCSDTNTFTLPSHESESLTEEESAERIATHFAEISNELPALDINSLPARVQTKLSSTQKPPIISEYETYNKIRAAKKTKSGIPNDLPKLLVQEFGTELATPVSKIINNIVQTGEWPNQWKLEYVSPIGKVPMPESEDELRPISLTAYFSKVTEHFVVMWLMEYLKDSLRDCLSDCLSDC